LLVLLKGFFCFILFCLWLATEADESPQFGYCSTGQIG